MSIRDGMKWLALAGAALALGGCVAAPPPGAYDTGAYQPVTYTDQYGEPVYAYDNPAPYNAASATTVYQPVPVYTEPYYAPVYPATASIGFGIYDYDRRYSYRDRRDRRINSRRYDDRPLRAERRERRREANRAALTAEERAERRERRRQANRNALTAEERAERRERRRQANQNAATAEERAQIRAERQAAREARRDDRPRVRRGPRRGTVDAAALLRRYDSGERSRSREPN